MLKKLLFLVGMAVTSYAYCTLSDIPLSISTQTLVEAYNADPLKSDQKFKYKNLRIMGKYASTNLEDMPEKSKLFLLLESSNPNFIVKAYGEDDFVPSLASYTKGQDIFLVCMGEGIENRTIKLSNCSVAK